mmetsp:Transcript_22416/g.24500  ORF Transcript_22416/g.24500 Transcript_22416/m.24500 type:complete len:226 (-) Transcript_22416:3743-4420(-)
MMFVFILILTLVSIPYIQSQKFNIFKSYKDAAIKPDNYGKVIQREHPVTEYLDSKQMKMLRERNGPITPENSFDNKWSGFKDKSVLMQNKLNKRAGKKQRRKSKSKETTETDDDGGSSSTASNDRRRLSWDEYFRIKSSSSTDLKSSFAFQLPVLLEGNANQNLFYVLLYGLILSGMTVISLYFIYKIALSFSAKRSNSNSNSVNQIITNRKMKCDKNGVCELNV